MNDNRFPLSDFKSWVPESPIRWLIICGAVLISAIAIGTVVMVGNFRERALHSSERELDNTVLLLARHFDQQLEDFGAIQRDVVTQIRHAGIASSANFNGQMSTLEAHEVLRAKVSGHSDVAGVNLFDSDGMLINSSETWPVPDVKIADRAFFKAFKSGPVAAPALVELVQGRFTGGWATVISHRVTGPEGQFLGLVTRAITPARPASAEPMPKTTMNTRGTLWPSIATICGCVSEAWMMRPARVRVRITKMKPKMATATTSMKAL